MMMNQTAVASPISSIPRCPCIPNQRRQLVNSLTTTATKAQWSDRRKQKNGNGVGTRNLNFSWMATVGENVKPATAPTSVPVRVAHELQQAGHRYLDVRTPEEFATGHAVGAINVPYLFKLGSDMAQREPPPEFIGGIDDWDHLQFDEGTPAWTRFRALRHLPVERHAYIDWDVLEELGERDRALTYVPLNSPWDRLFKLRCHAYTQLTLEFLCTFQFRPRDQHAPPVPESDITSGAVEPEVSFSMLGRQFRMSLRRFAVMTRVYTQQEVTQPMYTQSVRVAPDDSDKAWWPTIGNGQFHTGATKASAIRDPLFRYLFRLIAATVTGRRAINKLNNNDLFFLRRMITGTPVNLAFGLADYFHTYYHRSLGSHLCGGTIVARIARSLGLQDAIEELDMFSTPARPADRSSITAMRIGKVLPNGRFRFVAVYTDDVPFVPQPLHQPEDLHGLEVEIEDMQQMLGGDDDVPVPPPGHQDPQQHPARVYRAIRLPERYARAAHAQLGYAMDTNRMARETHEMQHWLTSQVYHGMTARGIRPSYDPPASLRPGPPQYWSYDPSSYPDFPPRYTPYVPPPPTHDGGGGPTQYGQASTSGTGGPTPTQFGPSSSSGQGGFADVLGGYIFGGHGQGGDQYRMGDD